MGIQIFDALKIMPKLNTTAIKKAYLTIRNIRSIDIPANMHDDPQANMLQWCEADIDYININRTIVYASNTYSDIWNYPCIPSSMQPMLLCGKVQIAVSEKLKTQILNYNRIRCCGTLYLADVQGCKYLQIYNWQKFDGSFVKREVFISKILPEDVLLKNILEMNQKTGGKLLQAKYNQRGMALSGNVLTQTPLNLDFSKLDCREININSAVAAKQSTSVATPDLNVKKDLNVECMLDFLTSLQGSQGVGKMIYPKFSWLSDHKSLVPLLENRFNYLVSLKNIDTGFDLRLFNKIENLLDKKSVLYSLYLDFKSHESDPLSLHKFLQNYYSEVLGLNLKSDIYDTVKQLYVNPYDLVYILGLSIKEVDKLTYIFHNCMQTLSDALIQSRKQVCLHKLLSQNTYSVKDLLLRSLCNNPELSKSLLTSDYFSSSEKSRLLKYLQINITEPKQLLKVSKDNIHDMLSALLTESEIYEMSIITHAPEPMCTDLYSVFMLISILKQLQKMHVTSDIAADKLLKETTVYCQKNNFSDISYSIIAAAFTEYPLLIESAEYDKYALQSYLNYLNTTLYLNFKVVDLNMLHNLLDLDLFLNLNSDKHLVFLRSTNSNITEVYHVIKQGATVCYFDNAVNRNNNEKLIEKFILNNELPIAIPSVETTGSINMQIQAIEYARLKWLNEGVLEDNIQVLSIGAKAVQLKGYQDLLQKARCYKEDTLLVFGTGYKQQHFYLGESVCLIKSINVSGTEIKKGSILLLQSIDRYRFTDKVVLRLISNDFSFDIYVKRDPDDDHLNLKDLCFEHVYMLPYDSSVILNNKISHIICVFFDSACIEDIYSLLCDTSKELKLIGNLETIYKKRKIKKPETYLNLIM